MINPQRLPRSPRPAPHPRNVDGQAIAITVFSTVKWWGRLWLPLVFSFARLFPKRARHARAAVLHPLRPLDARQAAPVHGAQRELRYPHLFFESNFNGGWEEYIDAFSHILTRGMKLFWGSSYGFPTRCRPAPFKDYIKRNEIVASHFYCGLSRGDDDDRPLGARARREAARRSSAAQRA